MKKKLEKERSPASELAAVMPQKLILGFIACPILVLKSNGKAIRSAT
jgi:hypothetical protein